MVPKRSAFKFATGVTAAALLWSQAATAAVTPLSARVDPLVALSALGTAGSQGAVCGAGAQAAAAGAAAAAQGAAGGCVLPVSDVPPPPPPAAGPVLPPPGPGFNVVPLLLGLAAIAAAIAIIASNGSNGSGNLTPVSPA